jgi:hypothetical protein
MRSLAHGKVFQLQFLKANNLLKDWKKKTMILNHRNQKKHCHLKNEKHLLRTSKIF